MPLTSNSFLTCFLFSILFLGLTIESRGQQATALAYPDPPIRLQWPTDLNSLQRAQAQKIETDALFSYEIDYLKDYCRLRGMPECYPFTSAKVDEIAKVISQHNMLTDKETLQLFFKKSLDQAAKEYEQTSTYKFTMKLVQLSQRIDQQQYQMTRLASEAAKAADHLALAKKHEKQSTYLLILAICTGLTMLLTILALSRIN